MLFHFGACHSFLSLKFHYQHKIIYTQQLEMLKTNMYLQDHQPIFLLHHPQYQPSLQTDGMISIKSYFLKENWHSDLRFKNNFIPQLKFIKGVQENRGKKPIWLFIRKTTNLTNYLNSLNEHEFSICKGNHECNNKIEVWLITQLKIAWGTLHFKNLRQTTKKATLQD